MLVNNFNFIVNFGLFRNILIITILINAFKTNSGDFSNVSLKLNFI